MEPLVQCRQSSSSHVRLKSDEFHINFNSDEDFELRCRGWNPIQIWDVLHGGIQIGICAEHLQHSISLYEAKHCIGINSEITRDNRMMFYVH